MNYLNKKIVYGLRLDSRSENFYGDQEQGIN